jgi:hypothetical protein
MIREIHPDFQYFLDFKKQPLIDLYTDLRNYILSFYPDSVELLYHTHALTSVYCLSEKLSNGFCMLPIYSNHVNFGFNKGTLLDDPENLLQGTGKLIRHIPVEKPSDYRNVSVAAIVRSAITLATNDQVKESEKKGITISKIKEPK